VKIKLNWGGEVRKCTCVFRFLIGSKLSNNTRPVKLFSLEERKMRYAKYLAYTKKLR